MSCRRPLGGSLSRLKEEIEVVWLQEVVEAVD